MIIVLINVYDVLLGVYGLPPHLPRQYLLLLQGKLNHLHLSEERVDVQFVVDFMFGLLEQVDQLFLLFPAPFLGLANGRVLAVVEGKEQIHLVYHRYSNKVLLLHAVHETVVFKGRRHFLWV